MTQMLIILFSDPITSVVLYINLLAYLVIIFKLDQFCVFYW